MSDILPWERQPGEGEEEWAAFQRFRDMYPPRRVEWAAVKSTAKLFEWAANWKWTERTEAYDRFTDKIRRDEREAMLKQAENERTANSLNILRGLEELFMRELKKLLHESFSNEMSIAKIGDLTKLANTLVEKRRLLFGESTENVHNTSEIDLSGLSLEELKAWKELQAKVARANEDKEE